MLTRIATLLLAVVGAAACQLQALNQEPGEVTLTPFPTVSAEATTEATGEPSRSGGDLGIIAAAPPTDIVAITITPISGASSAPTRPAPSGRCTATPSGSFDVNIREQPGAQYLINGVLRHGDYVDAYARTSSGWYQVDIPGTGFGWVSGSVVTLNGPCNLQMVSENTGSSASTPIPSTVAATPTSRYLSPWPGGYVFVTTMQVGNIPANTQVGIGSAYYDGSGWIYQIISPDGTAADARENQITWAPGVTPGAPTPTMGFGDYIGMGVDWFITTERIGGIPVNTRVNLSTAYFDGYDWIYLITADGSTFVEARQSQLAWAPDATPGAPTPGGPTAAPTAVECRAAANTALGVVNIRSGPGVNFAALNAFGSSDAVSVLGRTDNGWYRVRMFAFGNPFEGFAPAGEIALSGDCNTLPLIPAASYQATPAVQELPTDVSPDDVVIPEGMCTVIAVNNSANIYESNRPDSAVIGVLRPGPWLTVSARDGKGWYRVTLFSGGLGWMDGSQVQVNGLGGACDALPVL
jgi:uncharacterized protein YgiM (DUF1202 family)